MVTLNKKPKGAKARSQTGRACAGGAYQAAKQAFSRLERIESFEKKLNALIANVASQK
jgi:hypothetical protein